MSNSAELQGKNTGYMRGFIALIIAIFFILIGIGMHATALPFVTGALGVSSVYSSWWAVVYNLSNSILAPVIGYIGDRKGMKPTMLAGMSIFVVATGLLCFAPSHWAFMAGRFLQGFGVAATVPTMVAYILRFFPAEKRAVGFTAYAAVAMGGPLLGPVTAGVLCDLLGWRAMYGINTGLVVIAVIIVLIMMPKIAPMPQIKSVDLLGCITLFFSIGALLMLPTVGGQYGWTSPVAIVLMVVFVVFGIVFFWNEIKVAKVPVCNLSLFKRRTFTVAVITSLLVIGYMQLSMYLVSYFGRGGRGLSGTQVGLWSTILFIAGVIITPLLGKILPKAMPKLMALVIVVVLGITNLVYIFGVSATMPLWLFYACAVLVGIGFCIMQPLTKSVGLTNIPPEQNGSVSGMMAMVGNLGGPVFTTLFMPVFNSVSMAGAKPDFAAGFIATGRLMLIPLALILLVALFYPTKSAAALAKENAAAKEECSRTE